MISHLHRTSVFTKCVHIFYFLIFNGPIRSAYVRASIIQMFRKGRICASFAVTLRLPVMLRVSTEWPLHTLDYIITKHTLLWKRAWLLIYFQNHSWMPAVALWLTSCCRVLDSCFVFTCNMSDRKKFFSLTVWPKMALSIWSSCPYLQVLGGQV